MRTGIWILALVALLGVSCSGTENTISTEAVDTETPTVTPPPCAATDLFVDVMSNLGVTYDYDPSGSAAELADQAAVVVRGELIAVKEITEADAPAGPFLSFDIEIKEVIEGSVASTEPGTVEFRIGFNPAERPFAEIADSFSPGIEALVFLSNDSAAEPRFVFLEGFWVGCDDSPPVVSVGIEPVQWDSPSTLDELGDLVTEVIVDRQPNEPPVLRVTSGAASIELTAISYCWRFENGSVCSDGVAPEPSPSLGVITDPVVIEFDATGWSFQAGFVSDTPAAEREPTAANELEDTRWEIEIPDAAGSHQLDLFGQGPEGDVFFIVGFEIEN